MFLAEKMTKDLFEDVRNEVAFQSDKDPTIVLMHPEPYEGVKKIDKPYREGTECVAKRRRGQFCRAGDIYVYLHEDVLKNEIWYFDLDVSEKINSDNLWSEHVPIALVRFLENHEGEIAFTVDAFDDEPKNRQCPACDGKGKYTGFRWIEDPCEKCGGSGKV